MDRITREYTPKVTLGDAHALLVQGVSQLRSSEAWTKYLDFQASFHQYSFANTMLILMQCPHATLVAGYNQWRKRKRHVKKGETGIRIFVPRTVKVKDEDTGEEEERFTNRYLIGCVFDVSQTEGEPLPEAPVSELTGDDHGLCQAVVSILERNGWKVVTMPRKSYVNGAAVNGAMYASAKTVYVADDLEPAQRAKTLLHEWAHAYLHSSGPESPHEREVGEIEAESVAYILCRKFGIDAGDYSFAYLASWSNSDKHFAEQLRASGSRIQAAVKAFLELLGQQSGELSQAA